VRKTTLILSVLLLAALTYGYVSMPQYTDVNIPSVALRMPAANAPTLVSYKTGEVLGFTDQGTMNNEERIYMILEVNHDYQEGTDMDWHCHWMLEDNTACNVVWQLTETWFNQNGSIPAVTEYMTVCPSPAAADTCITCETGSLIGSGKKISSIVVGQFRRHSSHALDTCNGKTAYYFLGGVHPKTDSHGSWAELTKNGR